jgi:hypothetical protein
MADTPLVDVEALETLLRRDDPELELDEYADYTALIIEGASAIVRDEGDPNWVLSNPGDGETVIPARGRFIALALAKRAWEDQGNLQRRTTGPLSETFFEDGVRGLELTEAELDWLEGHQPDGKSTGTWILRMRGTGSRRPFGRGDETPDGYSFAAGDWDFAHGMTMSGPAKADNW